MCCLKCKKQGDGEFDIARNSKIWGCYKVSIQNIGHAGPTGAIYEAKYNSSVHDFRPLFQEVNGATLKLKL